MSGYILAIDQGTTSSRAIIFDDRLSIHGIAQQEFPQSFPKSGWVEHDPDDLLRTTIETARYALASAGLPAGNIAGIGITNQRETTIVWERSTGRPIHPAIVWQDRRTADMCARLAEDGTEAIVAERTGLLLDPYFSGSKLAWLLDHVPGARARAEEGELAFGTVDSWLIWNLTGGTRHVTDPTNACRTLLYNVREHRWDPEMLRLLNVPEAMLPEVLDNTADFGTARRDLFGAEMPILGVAGDQQAATIGQACFAPGMLKSTYGTGCFALLNTGTVPVRSRNRLLTTIAYRLDGETHYALEGSIFAAGAVVQWLRDALGVVARAEETAALAAEADPAQAVYLVPAFTGLGAPYWDADARGALFGLTRATGPKELARAALESVCFQTVDLIEAMRADWSGSDDTILRVDGGMVANDWMMQRLTDFIGAPVDRPTILETTALGAAWLAGHRAGVWPDREGFRGLWQLDRRFEPKMAASERETRLDGWRNAVSRTLSSRF